MSARLHIPKKFKLTVWVAEDFFHPLRAIAVVTNSQAHMTKKIKMPALTK